MRYIYVCVCVGSYRYEPSRFEQQNTPTAYLQRDNTPHVCPGCDTTQFDCEAPVLGSTPSLPLLPCSFLPKVVAFDRVQSIGSN